MKLLRAIVETLARIFPVPLRRVLSARAHRDDWAARLRGVAGVIAGTVENEIGCDEVYELLDRYVEITARGENPAVLLPLVHDHLERCGDCREELEALLRILTAK